MYTKSSWQNYRDEPFLNDNGNIVDFNADNSSSALFKL